VNKRNPLIGLLKYSFFSMNGSLVLVILVGLSLGILSIFIEYYVIYVAFLPLVVFGGPAHIIMSKSEMTSKWEQFQVSMPIKRKDIATVPYIIILLALLSGIPVSTLISVIHFVLRENTMDFLMRSFANTFLIVGTVLLTAALFYPFAYTKFGNRSRKGLGFVCLIVAALVNLLIILGGKGLLISDGVIALLNIAISGSAFIISLFVAREIYTKIDF